jgi:hypothetical protein
MGVLVTFGKPGFRRWWEERGRRLLGPEFPRWIQSLVDANQT